MAWQTGTNSSSRSLSDRCFSSQYLVIGTPLTSSMTKYGRPLSVVPASSTLAIFGWSIIARACRSASKRAMTCRLSMPGLMILRATLRSHRLSLLGHIDDTHAAFADLLAGACRGRSACRGAARRAGRWWANCRPPGGASRKKLSWPRGASGEQALDTARNAASWPQAAVEIGGFVQRSAPFCSASMKISSLLHGATGWPHAGTGPIINATFGLPQIAHLMNAATLALRVSGVLHVDSGEAFFAGDLAAQPGAGEGPV